MIDECFHLVLETDNAYKNVRKKNIYLPKQIYALLPFPRCLDSQRVCVCLDRKYKEAGCVTSTQYLNPGLQYIQELKIMLN